MLWQVFSVQMANSRRFMHDGTARVISKLCNASLVIGHSQSANRITADIVMQAINDSTLG